MSTFLLVVVVDAVGYFAHCQCRFYFTAFMHLLARQMVFESFKCSRTTSQQFHYYVAVLSVSLKCRHALKLCSSFFFFFVATYIKYICIWEYLHMFVYLDVCPFVRPQNCIIVSMPTAVTSPHMYVCMKLSYDQYLDEQSLWSGHSAHSHARFLQYIMHSSVWRLLLLSQLAFLVKFLRSIAEYIFQTLYKSI